jgi:hypothetical protein
MHVMKKLIMSLLLSAFILPAIPQEFMKVAADPVIKDNKRCFQIKQGYSRKDKTTWEPYCGVFENFYYEQGYEYTLYVEKYNPQADTIKVLKTIGRDNSDSYRKQQELRKKREEAAK